jgi:hypothetical protein
VGGRPGPSHQRTPTEVWFDDAQGIAALFADPDYLARIRPDEERFLDLHGCDFVVSRENAVF